MKRLTVNNVNQGSEQKVEKAQQLGTTAVHWWGKERSALGENAEWESERDCIPNKHYVDLACEGDQKFW